MIFVYFSDFDTMHNCYGQTDRLALRRAA